MRRRIDEVHEAVEYVPPRRFIAILAVVLHLVLAAAIIGNALQAMALEHIGEVLK